MILPLAPTGRSGLTRASGGLSHDSGGWPGVRGRSGAHYCIDPRDPAIGELANDASHYADGLDEVPPGVVLSARATLRANQRAVD